MDILKWILDFLWTALKLFFYIYHHLKPNIWITDLPKIGNFLLKIVNITIWCSESLHVYIFDFLKSAIHIFKKNFINCVISVQHKSNSKLALKSLCLIVKMFFSTREVEILLCFVCDHY